MNKFLRNIGLFILFTMITYPILIILWGEFMPYSFNRNLIYPIGANGHMFSRIQEISKFSNVDILFLGSSHAYRGFDPRIFGQHNISSFNLGSSFQTPIQTEILLKRYLKHLNPKLVIFEVYPEIFTNDGVESSLDLIANDKIDVHTVKMAFSLNHIKTYNALIYSFYRTLFKSNENFVENRIKENDIYVNAGYVERAEGKDPVPVKREIKEWELREDQKLAFERIVAIFREKGIKFVLVQAPITTSLYESYKNNDEVDEYFKRIGKYYNFNEAIEMSEALHFYDQHHLNQGGVEIFDNELIRVLKENSDIK